ncbi:MAG TPA: glycosyltransferase family 4 protein [Pyrinomonadaceae bacterium]|nr:glycosyltransferase family 4 protein [Pyrinomonadaceae bacterium]
MRILYFYQYFTTPKGAWSTRVYEFARCWVGVGDTVTVVTSVYDKSDLKPDRLVSRFDVDGIDVRVINIRLSNKHSVLLRILTFATYALLASWYALVLPADVVVCSSGPLTVGLPGLVARYFRRRPFVFEVRDLPEVAIEVGILHHKLAISLARLLEKTCYRAASRVVALSEGMALWIGQTYGFQHVYVIPNASDNELVAGIGGAIELPSWAYGKHLALYTGTLGLMYDCGQILHMARVIQDRGATDLEFVLIGDGKERTRLEEKMRDLKLNNVHFLGLIPKEEVIRWLRIACCSLYTVKDIPTVATSSPNKLFEAFAVGVPVVQATQGWIKDLLAREQCGITVAPNDPRAMADAVLQLARNAKYREALAANARRVARDVFDRRLLAGKMRGVLATASADKERAVLAEQRYR